MFTTTTREIVKLATHGLTRKLIVGGLAASVIFGAVAEAQAKMVCYKDPGRGMVCTKVK